MLLPLLAALIVRSIASRQPESDRPAIWLKFFRLNRFVMAAAVAIWWAICDWREMHRPFHVESSFFWAPPIVGLGIYLLASYSTDSLLLGLRWKLGDVIGQAWWRLASFVVPLLMIASGFDDLLHGAAAGVIWIFAAAVLARIGTILFQRASGLNLRELKSGELRNRCFAMARKMETAISRVYLVPAGRGHLTNAYGGGKVIGLTDNLGKYIDRRELDSIIAHELTHVKQKHGRKKLFIVISTFTALTVLSFLSRPVALRFKFATDAIVIFVPLLILYFSSRRFEYAADRGAVDALGDPEITIRALAQVYRVSAIPPKSGLLTELFSTHPSLIHRAEAIARTSQIESGRNPSFSRRME